jgi:hypothetical protein
MDVRDPERADPAGRALSAARSGRSGAAQDWMKDANSMGKYTLCTSANADP